MNKEIINTISDFNSTLLSLAFNISSICPNSIIGTNIKDIEKTINRKVNFTKFIDLFCIKVLQYKNEIDEGKESFFLGKDYKKDLEDHASDALNHVITMKSIWGDLSRENKNIVILNMQILCELAQQYFNYIKETS